MRALKVYGWTALLRTAERQQLGLPSHVIQCRCIIAAESMAEVGRLTKQRPTNLFNLCETGNAREIEIAMQKPKTFFVAPLTSYRDPYIEVPPEAVQ